jgi:hypothetical protein
VSSRHFRYCVIALFLGVVGYGVVLSRLTGGEDFVNSYPFIRADGFDWLYQGYVLYERLRGQCVPVLWFLRDPGFILVCALDVALGAAGLVVILAHTLSFFVTGLALLKAARLYALPLIVVASVTAIVLLQPLNYVRLFVLADPLAVGLLTVSTYAMLHHLRTHSLKALTLSALLALIGGMTQTYAAIPFIVGTAVSVIANARSRQSLLNIGAIFVGFAVCLLALTLAWRAAMPHEEVPIPFSSLQLSFDMVPFYARAWSLVYVPLLPFAVTALVVWWRSDRRFHSEVLFLGVTVVLFAGLSVFYQWAEARFTFIYQPVVLLLLMALGSPAAMATLQTRRRWDLATAGALCSAVLVAGSVAVTPLTYYGPPTLTWRPRSSWILEAWFSRPVDRFELARSRAANVYSQATQPDFGPYPGKIVAGYLALRMRQQDRALGLNGVALDAALEPGCRQALR